MSDPKDVMGDAVERLEWDERKEEENSSQEVAPDDAPYRADGRCRRDRGARARGVRNELQSSRHASAASSGSSACRDLRRQQAYHFMLVNHVTTNVFFTPTQNGAADACKLLGCSYTWTGSATSNVSEMVNAINSAVSSKANGIASSLIDPTAFNAPVQASLSAGIPFVAYNADEPQTGRLAYIGQDLFVSGQEMGQHIQALLPSGGQIALFIATPGAANIQPRINGALATLKSTPNIKPRRRRDRRRRAGRADRDQLLGQPPLLRQGDVRGRRRLAPRASRRRSRSWA